MDCSEFRDILPLIASQMGIISATRLLLTCKRFVELLDSDEFWRVMIKCRFGASDGVIKSIRQAHCMYIRLYYSDIARCDEVPSGYDEVFCDVSLIAYYQAVGLAKVKEHLPKPGEATSSRITILPWAFWYSSEENLIKVFEAIKPTKHTWDVGSVDVLAVPADRRKVIKDAIVKYCNIDEGYAARELGGILNNSDPYIRGFDTVLSLAWEFEAFSHISRVYVFPHSWLIALELQDRAEKIGSWATCHPPLAGKSELFAEKGVDIFIQQYN